MNEQIPNSVSSADLQKYLNKAPAENKETVNGKTIEQLNEIADRLLNQALEESGGSPAVHKIMALKVIMNLGNWHAEMAEDAVKRGEINAGANCMADYGQLRSAYRLLDDIVVSEFDNSDDESEE